MSHAVRHGGTKENWADEIEKPTETGLSKTQLRNLCEGLTKEYRMETDGPPLGGGFYEIDQIGLQKLAIEPKDLQKLPGNIYEGMPTTSFTGEALPEDRAEKVYVIHKPNLLALIQGVVKSKSGPTRG